MTSHCRQRGKVARLQPKFVGPYCVIEMTPNHTYKVERSGQVSIQNEARLKPYWASPDAAGHTPPLLETARRPPMRGRGMAYREIKEVLPDREGAADAPTDLPRPPHLRRRWPTHQKTSLSRPHHQWSRPTCLLSWGRWHFLKFIKKRQLGRHHSHWWTPVLVTPPVVVESPAAANYPVSLERSQRTKAPPSYLKNLLCDEVDRYPSAIIKEIWGDKQLRVARPRYKETQL